MAKTVSSFNTTFTPTNRYGFCRVPDGNGPLGSIAVNGTPCPLYLAFSFKAQKRLHHYKNMYRMEW